MDKQKLTKVFHQLKLDEGTVEIYFCLWKFGLSTALELNQRLEISRTQIYRYLDQLTNLELVRQQNSSYLALPLENVRIALLRQESEISQSINILNDVSLTSISFTLLEAENILFTFLSTDEAIIIGFREMNKKIDNILKNNVHPNHHFLTNVNAKIPSWLSEKVLRSDNFILRDIEVMLVCERQLILVNQSNPLEIERQQNIQTSKIIFDQWSRLLSNV
ncbi:hypothetical protein KBC31_01310 [Candidatus Saccharibacteria bacterium]|nr:hypothetical protein [Candidatus Saccharibacteria bacterium]